MHHFFADPARIGEKEITLTGADVNHIRNVLRMRPGEEVLISDGQGTDYRCKLETLTEEYVAARICWVLEGNAELPSRITLYFPKGTRWNLSFRNAWSWGFPGLCLWSPSARW